MPVEDKAEVTLNQHVWGLLVSYTALGAAEHWFLRYFFWLSFVASGGLTLSILVTLVFRHREATHKKPVLDSSQPTRGMGNFLAIAAVLILLTGATLWISNLLPLPLGGPLLTGPPEFVILSLIAALALYLRQVNLNAVDQHYKIRHGQVWDRPPESKYVRQKLERLKVTSDSITLASPFMFALILVVCGRIVCDSFSRFYYEPKDSPRFFYSLDCVIAVWLSVTFMGLTIAHFVVRRKDNRIQKLIKADDDANPPLAVGAN